jgi:hypothetical protein
MEVGHRQWWSFKEPVLGVEGESKWKGRRLGDDHFGRS